MNRTRTARRRNWRPRAGMCANRILSPVAALAAALLAFASPGAAQTSATPPAPSSSGSDCGLVVMISGAFTPPFQKLSRQFEAARKVKICQVYGPSIGDTPTAIPNRLKRGEAADVVILVRASLDDLVRSGLVAAGSETDLVRSQIGMAVREGAPKPDISTSDKFRQALLEAKSVVYSISASGVYLTTEVFPRLGIADQMAAKSRQMPGTPVAEEVAAGRAEVGFQQISELKAVEGAELVGPIPAPWQRITTFSAGVPVGAQHPREARDLIRYLTSPGSWPVIVEAGLSPAGARD